MAKCCAVGCVNSYHKGFTLVRFPADEGLKEQWRIAVGRPDWLPSYNDRLCEVHFEKLHWDGKRLKAGAVPSLFCTCDFAANSHSKMPTLKQPHNPLKEHDYSYSITGLTSNTSMKKTFPSVSQQCSDHDGYINPKLFSHKWQCPMRCVNPSGKKIGEPLKFNYSQPLLSSALQVSPPTAKDLLKKKQPSKKVDKENSKLRNEIVKLSKELQEAKKTQTTLEEKLNQEEKWWSGKFGHDQIEAAKTGNSKGRKWSEDSVIKGLQVRFSGGSSGLKCANKIMFPLPGIRTLQRRTQHIPFLPGVLHDILDAFGEQVKTFEDCDKDCLLFFDEMSIKSRIDFDPATKSTIGKVSLDGVDALATKAMVFVLGGIRRKWKITAVYHFVPSFGCKEELKVVILELLEKALKISLNVLGAVCDMGNRGLLALLGFCTKKDNIKNCIPHPVDPSKPFYCIPDMVHIFKSFKEVFSRNEYAELPVDVVQKFSLPSSIVKFSHISFLAIYQEEMDVKFAPGLKASELESNHFNKMKVSSATNVINDKVAEGLNFLVYSGEAEEECATTAWFLNLMNSWFKLVTSRNGYLALSRRNPEAYQKAIDVLKLVLYVFSNMSFGGCWKVVQTHTIIATMSVLSLQEYLLDKEGYLYVCLGRFLQDLVENLFSLVRAQCPTPTALQFKYRLKQLVLSQLSVDIAKGSYDHDDRVEAISLRQLLQSKPEQGTTPDVTLPSWEEPPHALVFSVSSVLYRMCGYTVFSLVQRKIIKCQDCIAALQNSSSTPHFLAKFTTMTNFKQDAQVEVNDSVFQLLNRVEFNLQKIKSIFCNNAYVTDLLIMNHIHPLISDTVLSTCHPITTVVVKAFVTMRLKQFTTENKSSVQDLKASSLASKSMGSRYLADKFGSPGVKRRSVPKETAKRLCM